ncbi:calcium antiporter [Cryptosporidium felis]|nr:calcium antiporter [Cryptosporidium felis]
MISRLTALLLSFTYILFLFFQLYTHINLFKDEGISSIDISHTSFAPENINPAKQSAIQSIEAYGHTLFKSYPVIPQSECLVDSINGFVSEWNFSENFIGVILLPLVGNAAEHITAVSVAIKNKTDLTIGVAVGSSTQIALFVVPFSVIVGWLLGKPMTLSFTPVSAIILLLANLIVIGIVQDGESNWFEGVLLIISYCIVAVVYWYI